MIWVIISSILAFPPPTQTCSQFVLYLGFLAIQQLFFFTLEYYHLLISRMLWGLLHLLRNSWYWDASHHHHSFLVPVLLPTGVPTSERCCLNSALLASLLLWSEILRLSIIESPFWHWPCNPTHRAHLSTNVYLCMFPSSILPCIICSDKCYLLVHLNVEIHPLEISMDCRWVNQSPPHLSLM